LPRFVISVSILSGADSVSTCANVNWVSKPPAGEVALVVQLSSVGHPLVDQHEAGAIFLEQLAQDVPGAGGLLVVLLDAGIGLLAAELPRQLAPEGSHHGTVGLL